MENENNDLLIITAEEAGERLDKILARRFEEVRSRTYFQYLIDQECVLLNGEPIKKRAKPKTGDEVEIEFQLSPELELTPEAIPLDIIFEDDSLIVVNKPAGMVVHPAVGNWHGTFVNALLYHCQEQFKRLPTPDPTDPATLRPGIVHRLDKDTSGLLVAAKNPQAHQRLVSMFASREIFKEYLAICIGNPGNIEINAPIGRHPVHRKEMSVREEGGKEALSFCRTLTFDGKLSVVSVVIATGRTHQIRVHLAHVRAPVLGDATYGSESSNKKYGIEKQMLHAHRLKFNHPISGVPLEFEAPLPINMQKLIHKINPKLCVSSFKE